MASFGRMANRVKENTTTTGTGTLTLAGATSAMFQTFTSQFATGAKVYYCIEDSTNNAWEVGLGTFTTSGTTLSRDTIYDSSNSGSAVSLAAGTKTVACVAPAAGLAPQFIVGPTLNTTTSQITGIPSGVRRVSINLRDVATNGTSDYLLQIGPSSGVLTTGYIGRTKETSTYTATFSAGFILIRPAAATTPRTHGTIVLTRAEDTNNDWVMTSTVLDSVNDRSGLGAGWLPGGGTLERVRLTTVNGTDAFNSGAWEIAFD